MTTRAIPDHDSVDPLWTTGDVARFLRCSKRQIPRLREEGLPSIRIGGLVRFVPDQVKSWLGLQDSHGAADERARQLADIAVSGDDAAECAAADLAREFPSLP
jgi:excisionase family DNA binding protein